MPLINRSPRWSNNQGNFGSRVRKHSMETLNPKGMFKLGAKAIGERRPICPMWHANEPPRPLIRK